MPRIVKSQFCFGNPGNFFWNIYTRRAWGWLETMNSDEAAVYPFDVLRKLHQYFWINQTNHRGLSKSGILDSWQPVRLLLLKSMWRCPDFKILKKKIHFFAILNIYISPSVTRSPKTKFIYFLKNLILYGKSFWCPDALSKLGVK